MKIAARFVWLVLGLCPFLAQAQISMGRPGFTPVPPVKKTTTTPATSNPATLTADEQTRLALVMKSMKPKARKRLAKTIQKMTPEQRKQLISLLKQQLSVHTARK